MTILTPSTGEQRPSGDMRLNVRGFVRGDRVLFQGFCGWSVEPVSAPMDKAIRVGAEVLQYRQVLGVVPSGCDEAELVAQLRHADDRRKELIGRANTAYAERVRQILERAELEKQGPPLPLG